MTDTIDIQKRTPPIDLDAVTRPQGYVMEDNDLRAAANAALVLGKPLLLTGEAGVGKSQFSGWLAYQLELGQQLKFVVKSTTDARELFYQYDALARFHEAQVTQLVTVPVLAGDKPLGGSMDQIDPRRYIAYNALGKAILYSLGAQIAREKGLISSTMGALLDDFPQQPRRSVVLIDEIDKAPRDVPNDILDEIDNLSFTVRELGNITIKASREFRPVVVMTSNSERDLPKPFLRRCVYYHMKFPPEETLARIVTTRVGARYESASGLLGQAISLFRFVRERAGLRQTPGLAELLDFLYSLAGETRSATTLGEIPNLLAILKATLLKDRHDQDQSDRHWQAWLKDSLNPQTDGRGR